MKKHRGSDSKFLEHAAIINSHLLTDLPDFTAFDPGLNDEKRKSLELSIEDALNTDPDQVVLVAIKGKTGHLKAIMEEARTACDEVFYFAEKFAKDSAILDEFGIKRYLKAKKVQPTFAAYLPQLSKVVDKYRTELISAGAKESLLNSIAPLAKMVESSNIEQETLKDKRPESTINRVDKLANIYDILKEFNNASKRVYAKDALKRSRYFMSSKRRSDKKK